MSTTTLNPILTRAGLLAVFKAHTAGQQVTISEIAVGDSGWQPNNDATGLKHPRRRIAVKANRPDPTRIQLSALDDSDEADYWIREVGIYLDDGTLLAVWSDPKRSLAYKNKGVDLLLAFDLALHGVPSEALKVAENQAEATLFLASELAKIATAQIDNMTRFTQQTFTLLEAGTISH